MLSNRLTPPSTKPLFQDMKTSREAFNQKALKTFNTQYKSNLPYKNYCDALGKKAESITSWKNIPPVTTEVFKHVSTPIIAFPKENIKRTFTTSGTTGEIKGQHHFPSLEIYEQSIITCWQQLSLPTPTHSIFLTQKPEDAHHSSLSHMMGTLAETYSEQATWVIDKNGKIDIEKIVTTIKEANDTNQPIALLGTALAFLYLFENLPTSGNLPPLPKGSWAMETGGYKGTQRILEKKDLYDLFEQKLGLAHDSIINEYSMTELSSQFYTRGLDQPHQGPNWTRIRVIDPLTEKEASEGQPGHLVIYDLANSHSVIAIRTQDIAIATGDNSFILLGRDPSALPRGCSRAADSSLRSS